MQAPFSQHQRQTLLTYNSGIWEGCFIRFDHCGQELDRFVSRLTVEDQNGTVVAALTNTNSGQVRTMAFQQPPAEMQISREGHWSLGPDRIGPWPWVSELCLVWGERRRRAVIRHGTDQLESLVLVIEGRPGRQNIVPPAPLMAQATAAGPNGLIWSLANDQPNNLEGNLELTVQTMGQRVAGNAEVVALRWQPEPGVLLEIRRNYGPNGLLEPGPMERS
ncbi:MAG: DUF3598 family protein [Cyanobium sp.]